MYKFKENTRNHTSAPALRLVDEDASHIFYPDASGNVYPLRQAQRRQNAQRYQARFDDEFPRETNWGSFAAMPVYAPYDSSNEDGVSDRYDAFPTHSDVQSIYRPRSAYGESPEYAESRPNQSGYRAGPVYPAQGQYVEPFHQSVAKNRYSSSCAHPSSPARNALPALYPVAAAPHRNRRAPATTLSRVEAALGLKNPIPEKTAYNAYLHGRVTFWDLLCTQIQNYWQEKEITFTMNRLSFSFLVTGILVLSALLMFSGFLIAINVYDIGSNRSLYSTMDNNIYDNISPIPPQIGMVPFNPDDPYAQAFPPTPLVAQPRLPSNAVYEQAQAQPVQQPAYYAYPQAPVVMPQAGQAVGVQQHAVHPQVAQQPVVQQHLAQQPVAQGHVQGYGPAPQYQQPSVPAGAQHMPTHPVYAQQPVQANPAHPAAQYQVAPQPAPAAPAGYPGALVPFNPAQPPALQYGQPVYAGQPKHP